MLLQSRHCFRGKEKTSAQGKPKHKEEDQYQNAMVTNQNHRPHLPDDMIYQILLRLPTKAAVRTSSLSKQWEGVWSLLPSLDFDEGGNPDNYFRHNDVVDTENLLRHKRFVNNILAKCLEYRQKHNKQKDVLDKLKIHMERYSAKDDVTLINKWLDFSFETGVKELDICLRISKLDWNPLDRGLSFYHCISRRSFFNAKSLTALTLEHARIKNFNHTDIAVPKPTIYTSLLPSLKTMCLTSVFFDKYALFSLIRWECPSIVFLSLAACSFEDSVFNVSSSSLKSLEVMDCTARKVEVGESVNLECFTLVSLQFPLAEMYLKKSDNLRYIDIYAQHLKNILLVGCHQSVKATIWTPSLLYLDFSGCVSYSNFHVKAPNLKLARIELWDLWDEEISPIDRPWKHFPTLRNFLKEFCCSRLLSLIPRDFKGLIFPENFKKTFSSPLPHSRDVAIYMLNAPPEATGISDFKDSLDWVAPSALIQCHFIGVPS